MSEPLRIAVVVEGPTDAIVLEAVVRALLPDREFELDTLQPEDSVAFGDGAFGSTGGGWSGVYRWCRQASEEGQGSVSGSEALFSHHVLIVHVDADVAGMTYADGNIVDAPRDDLPCEEPCPPAEATTNALREVLIGWLGEWERPPRVALCIPSMSTEAWVVAAVWPENRMVQKFDWECRRDPGSQLRALPMGRRFSKRRSDYRRKQAEIERGWQVVVERLTEAARFGRELLASIPPEHRVQR